MQRGRPVLPKGRNFQIPDQSGDWGDDELGQDLDGSQEAMIPEHVHLKHHMPLPGHEDHETYHSILLLVLFALMIGMQVGLFMWRKHRPMAFIRVTLGFLWLIPLGFSVFAGYTKFIVLWSIFSLITGYIIRRTMESPLQATTPKIIWRFFLISYRLCMGLAMAGYVMILLEFLGVADAIGLLGYFGSWGSLMIFYGLYFGVLWRDVAEICADRIASAFLFSEDLPQQVVPNLCSLCRCTLADNGVQIEKSFTLTCEHQFHESCIRGWTIVGKKDVCPVCKEKVDLKAMFPGGNPWARRSVLWAHLLDAIRYLIVWNPVIMVLMQVFLYISDPPSH